MTTVLPPARPGYSLEQPYYVSPDIFAMDLDLLRNTQWLFVDHESRIPKPGDYFTFAFGDDDIIVLRDRTNQIRAFHNVCRHRGSRICAPGQGRVALLTCPYHAWSYTLDGRLVSAKNMPDDFDPQTSGLHACQVEVLDGLIFLFLGTGTPPDVDGFAAGGDPQLRWVEALAVRRSVRLRAGFGAFLHAQEDDHAALAFRRGEGQSAVRVSVEWVSVPQSSGYEDSANYDRVRPADPREHALIPAHNLSFPVKHPPHE